MRLHDGQSTLHGWTSGIGTKVFFSPIRPDRLWDQRGLVLKGYRGLFPLK